MEILQEYAPFIFSAGVTGALVEMLKRVIVTKNKKLNGLIYFFMAGIISCIVSVATVLFMYGYFEISKYMLYALVNWAFANLAYQLIKNLFEKDNVK